MVDRRLDPRAHAARAARTGRPQPRRGHPQRDGPAPPRRRHAAGRGHPRRADPPGAGDRLHPAPAGQLARLAAARRHPLAPVLHALQRPARAARPGQDPRVHRRALVVRGRPRGAEDAAHSPAKRPRRAAQGVRRAGDRGPGEGRPQPGRRADPLRRRALLQRPQGPRRGLPVRRAGVRRRRARPVHRPQLQLHPQQGLRVRLARMQGQRQRRRGRRPARRRAGDGPVLPRRRRPRHRARADHLPALSHREVDTRAATRPRGRARPREAPRPAPGSGQAAAPAQPHAHP